MSGFSRAASYILACALGLTACARGATAPNPAATHALAPATKGHARTPTAPTPGATTFPIGVSAQRVGGRYVRITKQDDGRKVYVLRADSERGRYFGQDTGSSTFVNPHVTFFERDGKQLVADAPTGTAVEKDKTMRMSGGVRARSSDGLTLRSETLRYDVSTQTVHAEGNVTVTSPQGEELQGQTLDWNLRDGTMAVAGAH